MVFYERHVRALCCSSWEALDETWHVARSASLGLTPRPTTSRFCTWGKALPRSEPQYPHLQNEGLSGCLPSQSLRGATQDSRPRVMDVHSPSRAGCGGAMELRGWVTEALNVPLLSCSWEEGTTSFPLDPAHHGL